MVNCNENVSIINCLTLLAAEVLMTIGNYLKCGSIILCLTLRISYCDKVFEVAVIHTVGAHSYVII